MKNEMMISFSAQTSNVVFSRTVALGFLVNLNIDINVLNEIKTAISEAVTNAIVHGYSNDATKFVKMEMQYDDREIIIKVIDYGVGIEDIQKAREPLFSTKMSEDRAGLGFTIMEVFTDELSVESILGEKTIVTMKKKYHE
ncbi:MAG: anti-sigma F factor [Bacilli bacterium]|nr:anti-sigma F factor [Bacilli bacterium]